MIVVKEKDSKVFRIVVIDNSQVNQVKIQMEKIAIPEKINFYRQASEVLYSDLIKSYLNKQKMEEKMESLKQQNNRLKASAQAWKGQVKQLEADLLAKTSDANRKKEMKKLLNEKGRLIEELKKKLKLEPTDHPHTREFMSLQQECDSLKDEVLGLKAKIIQMDKEKQELISSQTLTLVLGSSQSDSNDQIIKLMAKVSDKDKEIDKLVKHYMTLEGEEKDSEIKVDRLKEKLKGYSLLKSTKRNKNSIMQLEMNAVSTLL